jgi:hypothetical protein
MPHFLTCLKMKHKKKWSNILGTTQAGTHHSSKMAQIDNRCYAGQIPGICNLLEPTNTLAGHVHKVIF